MQCPIDQTELVLAERAGVEIDYCPKCRGVWLDRGELDKIIDRSAAAPEPSRRHDEAREGGGRVQSSRKKRGGFLEELFDF